MKSSICRRIRRRPASRETVSLKKDNLHEQQFFGETTHEPFFKLGTVNQQSASVHRKWTDCEKEDKVQRSSDKKEEEKIHRQPEKKEEEKKVMKMADKKEEEKVNKKEAGASSTPGNNVSNYIGSLNGKGNPLPAKANAYFSSRMGHDFSDVKVHTGKEAANSANELNAKAYTVKNNIVFNEGQFNTDTTKGKKLIAHELTHVIQQNAGSGKLQMQAVPLLTSAQETAAIRFNRQNYDERSIRIIQVITGTGVDGVFGSLSARAVAAFQLANGVPVNGQVNEATINAMIPGRLAADRREHIVQLVVDFFNIPTTDTLSIHFDPTLAAPQISAVDFEPGNLRIIRLGALAFLTASGLQGEINTQLAVPAPVLPPLAPRPKLLTAIEEVAAIQFNKSKFNDQRSIRIIQGFIQANPDGLWGSDTVQRVAQFQHNNGVKEDGKVGQDTLSQMSSDLIAAGNEDSSLRLIVDYFNMRDDGNLLDIFYDPTVRGNADTDFRVDEPVRLRIGPTGINQAFERLVHTIAHEFEHVRRLKQGIVARATHEFLGESIEILSIGMPPEDLETQARGTPGYVPGFASDATRGLNNWNAMPLDDQKTFKNKFIAVRNKVRQRIAAGTPAQQALHAPLLANYNAVVLP